MSEVFISYARSTEREAKQIAELGYGIRRDDELPAHRAYAEVIEERLQRRGWRLVTRTEVRKRKVRLGSKASVGRARKSGRLPQLQHHSREVCSSL